MAQILQDRMTVDRAGGIVVFIIGARIHRWWKIHRWLPVALSMPRMLRELERRPDSGFLGAISAGGAMVQYWESVDKLLAYAHDRSGAHFPAWADFHRRVAKSGDVGVWHETYVIPNGAFECMYVNMPPHGLVRVSKLVPATGKRKRAKDRLLAALAENPRLPTARERKGPIGPART